MLAISLISFLYFLFYNLLKSFFSSLPENLKRIYLSLPHASVYFIHSLSVHWGHPNKPKQTHWDKKLNKNIWQQRVQQVQWFGTLPCRFKYVFPKNLLQTCPPHSCQYTFKCFDTNKEPKQVNILSTHLFFASLARPYNHRMVRLNVLHRDKRRNAAANVHQSWSARIQRRDWLRLSLLAGVKL